LINFDKLLSVAKAICFEDVETKRQIYSRE